MHRKLTILVALATFAFTAPVSAVVLWDQSDFDAFGPGFFNSISGGPPFGLTIHAVSDVTVGGTGWTINSVTQYYSALDMYWGLGIVQGALHVFPKTGPLPIEDPATSAIVPMTAAFVLDHFEVTASVNLALPPGEYWIGITPEAGSGPFGPEIHLASQTLMGDASASYDVFAFPGPPAWFNFNPGVDASILIDGELGGPVSVDDSSWGSVKQLYR